MLFIYDIFFVIFLLCCLPVFIFGRKYHKGFGMRLGIMPKEIFSRLEGRDIIWIHAVSVGEASSAQPLIEALRQRYPRKHIVISTITETGNEAAKRIAGDDCTVIYLPFDVSSIVKKVIRRLNPSLFIIIETEIWPNLILRLHREGIPVVLVNGRISASSFKGYSLLKPFIKPLLKNVGLFCMQTENDASKIKSLGAREETVKVTGNLKFDIEQEKETLRKQADEFASLLKLSGKDKVFIAGSTHYPEEKVLFLVYGRLLKHYPDLKMVVVPRHIRRVDKIENEARRLNLKPVKYSDLVERKRVLSGRGGQEVIILNLMGRLKAAYSRADIVFVGGSLAKRGGQNMIEPASFSKALMFGPHTYNFDNLAEGLLSNEAALMVKDEEDLFKKSLFLLSNPEKKEELGKNALAFLEESKGAAKKTINLIETLNLTHKVQPKVSS
ncbi:MAG: 3-deoxy-D-manno-octulosonic acid transferase [Candidatus Omnitrophica bacterium]|nr:3-deoxy-D-manno-octulosonic acid transferase [Candidatus Omnitrophota bacterium]